MSRKLSSYQKLKAKVAALEKDIYALVRRADEPEGVAVRARYTLIYDTADAVWMGSPTTDNRVAGGVLDAIKKGDEDE